MPEITEPTPQRAALRMMDGDCFVAEMFGRDEDGVGYEALGQWIGSDDQQHMIFPTHAIRYIELLDDAEEGE